MWAKLAKNIIIAVSMFLWSGTLFAQIPDTLWTRTYGGPELELGYSAIQATDSNYIICGCKHYETDIVDIMLLKVNTNGDTVWCRTYGSPDLDFGRSVQETYDGGFLIAGSTYHNTAGEADLLLVKTNNIGDIVWTKTYGGPEIDYATSLQKAVGGGYIVAGNTGLYDQGDMDIWLLRIDENGDTLWTQTYGDNGQEIAEGIETTSDNGYVIIGSTDSFGLGSTDVYLVRTNSVGDELWARTYGDVRSDRGNYVLQTYDGGYIIAGGRTPIDAGQLDLYLIKTDEIGDTLWSKMYGGVGTDEATSLFQTSDRGYLVVGFTSSFGAGNADVYLLKTDENGDTVATTTYGGANWDSGHSLIKTSDHGYLICGFSLSFGNGDHDVYLIKLTSDQVGIDSETNKLLPDKFILHQNYPNPFNPRTTIYFELPNPHFVTLKVYDLLGREVKTLIDEQKHAGTHNVIFDASQLTSGIYFYRLQAGDFIELKRMAILK